MKEVINKIDELVKLGKSSEARLRLNAFSLGGLTRGDRCDLAGVARRAGLAALSLRLLSSVVRPPAKQPVRATETERAEYAAALVRVGATGEAIELLQSLDAKRVPEVSLYLAHAYVTRWDYAASIPLLTRYLPHSPSPYQTTITQLNLAAALVHERRHEPAQELLLELESTTRSERLDALYGNTLERLAELAIDRRRPAEAERYLTLAEKAVHSSGGLDIFFVKKWRCILNLTQKRPRALQEMDELRAEAISRRHWETVRECDAHRAVVTRDKSLLLRVYFGTPYEGYRQRLLGDFGRPIDLPDSFIWELSPPKQKRALDLLRDPAAARLKFGQLKHRLLSVLVSDFYRPFRLAHVFAQLYPGQRFHIDHSPPRVHQAIKDLRQWIARRRLPLRLVENLGSYQLESIRAGVGLLVPSPAWWARNSVKGLPKVRTLSKGEPFGASDVAAWLRVSRRSAANWIRLASERNLVVKIGAGPQTRYRFSI